ncbi:recombinase family protein, partial [Ruminococcus callidus]
IILEGLLEAMNEYYSAELSQKIKRGMRENAIKGKTTGGNVALGYRIGADKQMEIEPAGASLVRRIFTSYDNGRTFTEICDDLNHAGYTTSRGKQFRIDTISRILANQRYTGTFQCAGEDAHCPPIIEPELFRSVQERLTESRHKHRHTQSPHEYVLTGKAICGTCGRRLTGRAGTSKTDKRYYYYCCPNKCCGWLPAAELERAVLDAIAQYTTPEACEQIANATYALYQRSTHENADLTAAQRRLQETEKKLENAVNAVLNGITSAALQATMQQLEQQKAALETEVRLLQTDAPELKLEHFQYFAHRLLEVQAEGTEKILQLLVNQVIVYKDRITVLVNLTDKTKTPPLEQVTAALRESSCSVACAKERLF